MKGQLSVDPSFKPLAIKKPTLHLRHPLVAFDGHRIHFSDKSVLWNNKHIINCAYSSTLTAIMVLCSDWKLYVFNSNLDLIARLSDWESKYSVGFEYVEPLNAFLLIGVIEIEMLKVSIKTNLKQTKFLSSIKFGIQRKELKTVDEKNRLSWNKGYGYDIGENLLYVWSTQDINFYSLTKLQVQSKILKLVKKQTSITFVHLNRSYKYTITGLYNGNVKVWRLPLSPITSQTAEYIMIHNCVHHTKAVERIVPASDERLILSSSEDLTLCLWSLETFELLRSYNFEGDYTNIFLIDQKRAFAIQNGQLGQLTFGKTMEFIMQIDSPISFVDRAYREGKWHSFQITLEANIGIEIRNEQLTKRDLNKMEIGFFYPPLKAQSIRQVLASPYNPAIYFMLVEKGQLYSLRFEENASKIEQSFAIQHALDSQAHSLNQSPSYIAFLDLPNIRFDSEVTQSGLSGHKEPAVDIESASQKLKLITIGCSKGSIVILSLDEIDKIRARLTYHREMILNIQAIHGPHGYTIASICAQNYLRLISVDNQKAYCYFAINFGNSLKFMKSFEDKLVVAFMKGIFEIATAVSPEQLKVAQNLDTVDHQGEILSIDIQPSQRLIMSAGSDNRIKIWSMMKVLIYEIKLDQGLRYSIWSNNLQIFVAHRNKLLYLRQFSIGTSDLIEQNLEDLFDNPLFNILTLKECFSLAKRDQEGKLKEVDIDATQFTGKTKRKGHSLIYDQKDIQKGQQLNRSKRHFSFVGAPTTNEHSQPPKKKRANSRTKQVAGSFTSSMRTDEQLKKQAEFEMKLKATRKHMQQLNAIKQQTNQSLLPKIKAKNQDKFQQFINAKLINKKMLTRRDITLNRIIMKNLIKEQFSQEEDELSSLKLDF